MFNKTFVCWAESIAIHPFSGYDDDVAMNAFALAVTDMATIFNAIILNTRECALENVVIVGTVLPNR